MNEKIAEIAERMMLVVEVFNGNKWADDCSEQVKQDVKSLKEEYRKIDNASFVESRQRTFRKYFEKNLMEALSHKGEEVKHLTSDQQQAIFNFFHDKEVVLMDDDFNTLEEIIYPRTYPYTLKDEQQEKRYTAELKRIASIVHHGGLLGFITETSAMTEIRKITLPHWDKNEADKLQREAISKLDQFDSEGK